MSLGAGTYSPWDFLFYDSGNEPTHFKGYATLLSAADFVAQQTAFTLLGTKANALVLGAEAKRVYGNETTYNWAQPTNGAAREIKLLVQLEDETTGKAFHMSLGTINPALPHYVQNINAKDVVMLTEPTEIVDFISALEAFAINPETGNALTVVGLKVVGRST